MSILPKKRKITNGSFGLGLIILSIFVKNNVSDINKNAYKDIFDNYILQSFSLNFEKKIFIKIEHLEEYDFWNDDKYWEKKYPQK